MDHHIHYSILFVLGVGAFGGIVGAWLFQRLRIPQVVGYIAIGVLIGNSGINLIDPEHIEALRPFSKFALGIIGLLVGGELRASTFRQYGRQFATIMLGEGLLAFTLVGLSTGLVVYFVIHSAVLATAVGMVLGAIASATDPASTVDVLWEYRTRGVLTSSLIAIVALDDALAMTLYGIGKSVATLLAGGSASISHELMRVSVELGGAIVLGVLVALLLSLFLRLFHGRDRWIALLVGAALFTIGTAVVLKLDIILATMSLGVVLANVSPRRSQDLFELMRSMAMPVYVLFFVLIGASLNIGNMPGWLWGVAALYVFFRSVGKWAGAWIGGVLSHAEPTVRNLCGMGLFAQGGVAVGLSILASESLRGVNVSEGLNLGDVVVYTVTATTLCVQIIGPAMTKLAVTRAGEVGRNVTEEDIVASLGVADAMTPIHEAVRIDEPVSAIMEHFAEAGRRLHPVLTADGHMAGVVGFDALRDVLPERDAWDWLVAADIMRPPQDTVVSSTSLSDALQLMRDTRQEEMLVVDADDATSVLGTLETHEIRRRIDEELIRKSGE